MNRAVVALLLVMMGCSEPRASQSSALQGASHDDDADSGDDCHRHGKHDDCPDGGNASDSGMVDDAGTDDAGANDAGGAVASGGRFTPCTPPASAGELDCCADGGGDCLRFNPCSSPEVAIGCAVPRAGGGFVRGLDDGWRFQPDAGWHFAALGSWSNFFIRCGGPPDGCQEAHPAMCFAEPCPEGQVCNADGQSSGCQPSTPEQRDGGRGEDGNPDCDHDAPDSLPNAVPGCWEPGGFGRGPARVPDGGRSHFTRVCGNPQDGCPIGDDARCHLVRCREHEVCVSPSPYGVCNSMEDGADAGP